jgi:uncharacterized protein involved in outer membrane biogenesis
MKALKIAAKILVYLIGGVVGLVVVLLVAINFLLQSSTFTGMVLDKVLPAVGESIGARIEAKKLTLSIIPFRLRLHGVVFTPAEGNFRLNFAELDTLEVDVATGPLLSGHVVADRILIDGVRNYLMIDQNGLANLPIKMSEEEPTPPPPDTGPPDLRLPIKVKDLEIRNVSFAMDMDNDPEKEGNEMEVEVHSIGLDARADMSTGDTHAVVKIADGLFKMGDLADTLTSLELDADFSLTRWSGKANRLDIRIPQVELGATAELQNVLTEMRILGDLEGKIDISKVNTLLTPEPKLAGEMTLKVHADAPLPNYSAEGEILMGEACVNDLTLRDFKLLFAATQDAATVKELFVALAGGSLSVKADLGLKDDMPLTATVAIRDLRAGKAMEDFGIKGTGLSATVSGDIDAKGKLGGEEMDIASQVGCVWRMWRLRTR